jgi:MFS family permease
MNAGARRVQRVYLILLLLHTLAASFIWGINTLFLLDAGLTNTQAFAANAFFAAGLVLFEVPTGVVADMRGRRFSYLLGTLTLAVSTLLYLLMWRLSAPFPAWALASALLGLGFTFFSGAVQAWLVDALKAEGYDGALEPVFARGEIVEGVAMLGGSVLGGYLAQATNLGAPYVLRTAALALSFGMAFVLMHDVGFTPKRDGGVVRQAKALLRGAIQYGFANRPVRWVMIASAFTDGVSMYGFYAMQPYLLELYGDPRAYGIAGLSAAIVGGAQIAGGLLVSRVSRIVRRRTTLLLAAIVASGLTLVLIGLVPRFAFAVGLLVVWGLLFATVTPVRQAYLNELIPSEQRATSLSFDSLMGSGGGVVAQPLLGRTADVWGYPASYVCGAAIQLVAAPFIWLVRRDRPDL